MSKQRVTLKNPKRDALLVSHRILMGVVTILLCVAGLIARLVFLQITEHQSYLTLANKNQVATEPIPAARGLIYDRNGVILANNIPIYSLEVIPSHANHLWESLENIKSIVPLTENDIKQFKRQLQQHHRFVEIPLKLKLTEEQAATFAVNQYRFPGFAVRARLIRDYPFGKAFAHIIGHVGRINEQELGSIDTENYDNNNYIGKVGLEKYYEQQLHGQVGYERVEVDATGKTVRSIESIAPVSGDNLYLTIDSKLQLEAQKILGDHRGAIVIIDPNNGDILAMASNPSYDPNVFVTGINTADYETLQNDPDKPLYNRAVRGLYPIGSTIKPFLALAALNEGTMTPTETIEDHGWYKLKGDDHIFHDWKRSGHGTVDMRKAIAVSCDIYFYELSRRLGIRRIDNFLSNFGLGELTGIDMNEELAGNIPSPAWKKKMHDMPWYQGDTILTGIGQSYIQITPLNLASAVSGLATRGIRYRPHLLSAITNSEQETLAIHKVELAPVILNDKKNWDLVVLAMQDVIDGTYGYHFRFGDKPPYTVAAKTGTAQVVSLDNAHKGHEKIPEKFMDHSLFIGFAPADHPKMALAVIVENDSVAANLARQMFDYYLLTEGKWNEPA